jgi:hypothetical protein
MTTTKTTRDSARGANRRGIAGVWLVLSIPLFVAVLGFVLNVGFLWIAEADLENAAASGALTGAKVLGDRPPGVGQSDKGTRGQGDNRNVRESDSPTVRQSESAVAAAAEFLKANCVHGRKIKLGGNSGKHFHSCRSTILLGTVDGRTFRPSQHGSHGGHNNDACYVQLACKVEGPLGWLAGPKVIHASATAVVGRDGRPRLVEIDRVQRGD